MNRPVWPQRRRPPKIRMMSIAAGTDPGTDHPVIVTTGGKGIIVRRKNPNPANPPQSITNPKKPLPPKAEMRNVIIVDIGAVGDVPVIPAGAAAIVRLKTLAAVMEHGMVI